MSKPVIAFNANIVRKLNEVLNELIDSGEQPGEVLFALNVAAVEATILAFTHEIAANHFALLVKSHEVRKSGTFAVEGHC